jgi:glycine/D-amino acid oxidase-like deaminating enzyme
MADSRSASTRVVIVGGGISGLSIAARLAQAGLPVTVLEATAVGFGASTRNQGWLFSGGWFAPEHPELARMCHRSLEQTLEFCPECIEPGTGPMVYLAENPDTDVARWTSAWDAAGIPFQRLASAALLDRFPHLSIRRAGEAFELPDRAFQPQVLLQRLAQTAAAAGVEIRSGVSVSGLLWQDGNVGGVETSEGERLPSQLVILAGNAKGGFLEPGFGTQEVGAQQQAALMCLKTHLVAVRPGIGGVPLCVVDSGGFNHIPHPPASVFGSNHWQRAAHSGDESPEPAEIRRIWEHIGRLFPDVRREARNVLEWAGVTVQAMHVEQVEAGRAPLPTVVDHQWESSPLGNLVSVFPGRASLWPVLAEEARETVLRKLQREETAVAAPPWGAPLSTWRTESSVVDNAPGDHPLESPAL